MVGVCLLWDLIAVSDFLRARVVGNCNCNCNCIIAKRLLVKSEGVKLPSQPFSLHFTSAVQQRIQNSGGESRGKYEILISVRPDLNTRN